MPNVLAELRNSGHLSAADYASILLRLRRANCRFIDLDGDEIVHWLTKVKIVDGVVAESGELQVLRMYFNAALSDRNLRVAPLHLTDPSGRAIGEGAFAMNSAFAVNRALSKIWFLPSLSDEDRMALADWIVRSLYTGTFGVHHLYGGFKEARLLMVMDMADLLTDVRVVMTEEGLDFERGQAFMNGSALASWTIV